MSSRVALALAVALMWGKAAPAQDNKLSLGLYLPSMVQSREGQFALGQALALELGAQLGLPIAAKPFARFEDFAKAVNDGTLDLALADAVVLAQARTDFQAFATANLEEDPTSRWAVVAEQSAPVGRLKGKRLAVVKGPFGDAEFVNNVVFAGDLPAGHFQLVFVPAVESALKALETGKADAALVPAAYAPKGLKVLYRSTRVPAVVLVNLKADPAGLKAAVAKLGAVAPLGRFVVGTGDEVAQLKRRLARPPPARAPFISESPVYRPPPNTFSPFKATGLSFPTFLEFVEASKDHPDD